MVWDGRELSLTEDWIFRFDHHDILEIEDAVEASKKSSKQLGDLTQDDFPFNTLGKKLATLRNEVLDGRGFAVIRGLGAKHWNNEDLIRAYWGIGTWFGQSVSQNSQGHLLGHVIDQRSAPYPGKRVYQTNQAQPFHSDSCDIVGLLCLRQAKSGGASAIASSALIHNALLDQDHNTLEQLYGCFQCDRYNEIPEGKDCYYPVQIFNEIDHRLVCCGMDPDIRSAQRLSEVDRLTAGQLNAINAFQNMAKKYALEMTLERGDIQLVNNLTIVHARDEFEDEDALNKRRYLIRLWLSSPMGRRLPEFLVQRWGNIKVGSIRGGIIVPGATPTVHLCPEL